MMPTTQMLVWSVCLLQPGKGEWAALESDLQPISVVAKGAPSHDQMMAAKSYAAIAESKDKAKMYQMIDQNDSLLVSLAGFRTVAAVYPEEEFYAAARLMLRTKRPLYPLFEPVVEAVKSVRYSEKTEKDLRLLERVDIRSYDNVAIVTAVMPEEVLKKWFEELKGEIAQPLVAGILDRVFDEEDGLMRVKLEEAGRLKGYPRLVFLYHANADGGAYRGRLRAMLEDESIANRSVEAFVALHRDRVREMVDVSKLMVSEDRRSIIRAALEKRR